MQNTSVSSLLNRRQFIVGDKPLIPSPTWKSAYLSSNVSISYSPVLPIALVTDRQGIHWALLGLAVQTNPSLGDPVSQIRNSQTAEVPLASESWAGRWVLLGNDELYIDASGLLGCYYRTNTSRHAKCKVWISSSLCLLTDPALFPSLSRKHRELIHNIGFDYDPPPLTCYEGIQKLLPTEHIELSTGKVHAVELASFPSETLTYAELLDAMTVNLTTSLKNLARNATTEERFWLPLTAGYDSRLLLALASNIGLPIKTFTQITKGMTKADRTYPPLLSRLVGAEHIFIRPQRESTQLRELFDRHSAAQALGVVDRHFYAKKQWAWVSELDVVLRGLCFETGRCNYHRLFPPFLESSISQRASLVMNAIGEKPTGYVLSSLAEYFSWLARWPQEKIDWRDRFYIEVRLAGWASCMEQALDLLPGTLFHCANSKKFYGLVLSVPIEKRCKSLHHVDIITRLCPALGKIPFNPSPHVLHRVYGAGKKTLMMVRKKGLSVLLKKMELHFKQ